MPDTPFAKKALFTQALAVDTGQIVGLCGETGSGKSTFCRLLAGFLPESSQIVYPWPEHGRRRIGYMQQQPEQQFFAETVEEELFFGLRNFGFPKEGWAKRAKQVLHELELDPDLLSRDPLHLSGGQKRRVALASVLVYSPSLLVLDEPSAGLDKNSRQALWKCLLNQKAEGVTIVFVSHDPADLILFADQLIWFEQGKMQMGSCIQILKEQKGYHIELVRELVELYDQSGPLLYMQEIVKKRQERI